MDEVFAYVAGNGLFVSTLVFRVAVVLPFLEEWLILPYHKVRVNRPSWVLLALSVLATDSTRISPFPIVPLQSFTSGNRQSKGRIAAMERWKSGGKNLYGLLHLVPSRCSRLFVFHPAHQYLTGLFFAQLLFLG